VAIANARVRYFNQSECARKTHTWVHRKKDSLASIKENAATSCKTHKMGYFDFDTKSSHINLEFAKGYTKVIIKVVLAYDMWV